MTVSIKIRSLLFYDNYKPLNPYRHFRKWFSIQENQGLFDRHKRTAQIGKGIIGVGYVCVNYAF
jgi:hypothetical protein